MCRALGLIAPESARRVRLASKAQRLVHHSTTGSSVIKKMTVMQQGGRRCLACIARLPVAYVYPGWLSQGFVGAGGGGAARLCRAPGMIAPGGVRRVRLVSQAHRLVYHPTLGSRAMKTNLLALSGAVVSRSGDDGAWKSGEGHARGSTSLPRMPVSHAYLACLSRTQCQDFCWMRGPWLAARGRAGVRAKVEGCLQRAHSLTGGPYPLSGE